MRKPSTTLQLSIENLLGEPLAGLVASRRAEGASWQRIADEVRERTGVFVTDNTIRVWHLSAEVEPAAAGRRAS